MQEVVKSKKIWKKDGIEYRALQGKGIDIGCSNSPVFENVRCFDIEDGDANYITKYVNEQFDFVYSSHCLEHMHDPEQAILEWWKLVKVGGHLFFTVPDEDLYEQGVFPSRFNPDHKKTFTISKTKSWSKCSINVYDMAKSLPGGEIISLTLQDHLYDRNKMTFGGRQRPNFIIALMIRIYFSIKIRSPFQSRSFENFILRYRAIDQTLYDDTLAQIQCIVKKVS